MVTVNPAKSIGWDDKVGSISQGHFADIVVFDRIDNNDDDDDHADPYLNLIKPTEGNLKLSKIGADQDTEIQKFWMLLDFKISKKN